MTLRAPRTILVGFHTELNQGAVRAALEELEGRSSSPPFLGLVSRTNFLGDRADTFLHDTRGFRDLDWKSSRHWPIPSATLWSKLQPAEAVAMKLMDRTWRRSRAGRGHESRKRTWLQWATYAYGFLAHHRVERLLHCNVPHFGFQFVLFQVAQAMGIEARYLMQLQVRDTFIVASSIEDPHAATRERLGDPTPLPPLDERMQAELQRRVQRTQPFYMDRKGAPWSQRLHAAQRRLTRGPLRSIPAALAYRSARRRRGAPPGEGTPFVYLPLHLQPEATTLPLGGVYADQSIVIETLVRALPKGWLLVIKENPKQRFQKRSGNFYRTLAAHDCVRLVGRRTDSFALTVQAQAVATVTGTAGWEALCLGRPSLLFGPGFYEAATGATRIRSVEDARMTLAQIERGEGPVPTEGSCLEFLAALQEVSYEGVCDSLYLRDSELSQQGSMDTCAEAVIAGLTSPCAGGTDANA